MRLSLEDEAVFDGEFDLFDRGVNGLNIIEDATLGDFSEWPGTMDYLGTFKPVSLTPS